jgi:hypothetical protein
MSMTAERAVSWLTDLDQATERARQTGLPVFLDFYSPT